MLSRGTLSPSKHVNSQVVAGRGHGLRGATAAAAAAAAAAATQAQTYRVTDDTIQDVQSMYKSLLHEYDYKVKEAWVEGSVPKELSGTYFRNGPGMQVSNPRYKRHTFDGDGMVLSFTFKDGSVWFKNRYVRTQGFLDEQAAGRPVYRTAFTRGSADGNPFFNPLDFKLKNVANTGVVHWGNKLLALYESGLPHELDVHSLATLGPSDVGGQLETEVLAAHYRVMPGQQQLQQLRHDKAAGKEPVAGRTLVGFSFNSGVGGAELIFYEFAEDGSLSVPPQHYKLPGVMVAMIHDIAVTQDYYVVVVGPVDFSPSKFITEYVTSRCSIAECLQYDPNQATKVHLVPRPRGAAAGSAPHIIEAPAMFTFHHVNAFQVDGGLIDSATPTSGHPNSYKNGNSNGNANGNSNDNSNGSYPADSSAKQSLLVLDTVAWDEVRFDANQHTLTPEYYSGGARSQLRRLVFQLHSDQSSSSSSHGSQYQAGKLVGNYRLARRCTEFPSVNWDLHGQPHQHVYCCGDRVDDEVLWGPAQCVMKVTLPHPLAGTQGPVSENDVKRDIWDAGSRCIVNEPLFVPRPGAAAEDEGWVLVTVHDAEADKGKLVILDAQCLAQGPVATIHLQHFLPAGLHGSFAADVFTQDCLNDAFSAAPEWCEPNVVRAL